MPIIPKAINIYVHFDKIVIEHREISGDLTEEEAKTLIANAAPTLDRLKAVAKSQ